MNGKQVKVWIIIKKKKKMKKETKQRKKGETYKKEMPSSCTVVQYKNVHTDSYIYLIYVCKDVCI